MTSLLRAWRGGDQDAGRELMVLAYKDLRRLASSQLRAERPGHTLQPTALVHELYLRLFSGEPPDWQDRAHFLAMAARALRHIIVDYARQRRAKKRGGAQTRLDLETLQVPGVLPDDRVLEVEEALRRLESLEPRAASVVELRFFGGMSEKEIAAVLDISVPTVKRDWTFARSWLQSRLEPSLPRPH
jgi:RNA polymerase sigma factor (TIGR02999 family)